MAAIVNLGFGGMWNSGLRIEMRKDTGFLRMSSARYEVHSYIHLNINIQKQCAYRIQLYLKKKCSHMLFSTWLVHEKANQANG